MFSHDCTRHAHTISIIRYLPHADWPRPHRSVIERKRRFRACDRQCGQTMDSGTCALVVGVSTWLRERDGLRIWFTYAREGIVGVVRRRCGTNLSSDVGYSSWLTFFPQREGGVHHRYYQPVGKLFCQTVSQTMIFLWARPSTFSHVRTCCDSHPAIYEGGGGPRYGKIRKYTWYKLQ